MLLVGEFHGSPPDLPHIRYTWDPAEPFDIVCLVSAITENDLARTLSGHYELSVIPPPGLEENFKVNVKVKIPGTEVHFRRVQFPGFS